MRISDWSSDVCSSDLTSFHFSTSISITARLAVGNFTSTSSRRRDVPSSETRDSIKSSSPGLCPSINKSDLSSGISRKTSIRVAERSEEHTSELQSLMRISYAVFCLKKKNTTQLTSH